MWTEATLGDVVVDLKPGFARGAGGTDGVRIRHLRPNNVSPGGWLALDDVKEVNVDPSFVDRYSLSQGDILFNNTNSLSHVGKSALIDQPVQAAFSNHMTRLRCDADVVAPEFIVAWLRHLYLAGHFGRIARQWINQAAVNIDALRRLPVRYPTDFTDQQRIAQTAATLRGASVAAEQRLGTPRRIVARWFEDRLALEPPRVAQVALSELADVTGGLAVSPARTAGPGTAVAYVRVANVFRGTLERGDLRQMYVTQRELESRALADGDLLMVEGHGNVDEVGRVAQWDAAAVPCVHQNHLFRVRASDPDIAAFLLLLLNSQKLQSEVRRRVRVAAGINTLRISDVRRLPVAAPSREIAASARDAVDLIDALEPMLSEACERLRDLERLTLRREFGASAVQPPYLYSQAPPGSPTAELVSIWAAMSTEQRRIWQLAAGLERPFRASELRSRGSGERDTWQINATLEILTSLGVAGYVEDDVGTLWQIAEFSTE